MTLNDLERHSSPYFAFFLPNSIALLADYVTVVEDRSIMSVKYCLPVPVYDFRPKLTYPAARSICDSWASLLPALNIRSLDFVINRFLWYCLKTLILRL